MKKIIMVAVLTAVVVSVVAFDYFKEKDCGIDNQAAVVSSNANEAVVVSAVALPVPVAHTSPAVVAAREVAYSPAAKEDKQEATISKTEKSDAYRTRAVAVNYKPFLVARQGVLLKRNAAITNENKQLGDSNFEITIAKANEGKSLAIAQELQSSQFATLK